MTDVFETAERQKKIDKLDAAKNKLDFNKIPLDDKKTWDLIGTGYTKGVFQLEGNLGKRYAKEIKPRNIEQLSDLVSLIRPGCLEAEFRLKPNTDDDYSSITHTYIKIRNGDWEPEYIHPSLKPILEGTNSVPIYQEQIMRICTDFAGFTLKEADVARKAVGKKQNKEVFDILKAKFVAGALANGHNEDIANTIFGWIEKFSGYGFNKSHGVSYAMIGYRTAYGKAHYPLQFFKAMLANSDGKQDSLAEVMELVHEARLFNINVAPPSLQKLNHDFDIVGNDTIVFGLSHIKGVGKSALKSLKKISMSKSKEEFLKLAFGASTKVNKGVVIALIKSGSLDYITKNRVSLLAWYLIFSTLTGRERAFMFEELEGPQIQLQDAFDSLMKSKVPNKSRKPRIMEALAGINRDLGGTPKKMCIAWEKFYLGIPLSGSLVDLYYNPRTNIQLKNMGRLSNKTTGCIGVVIEKVRKIKDRNHNEMCFLTVSDSSYMIDSVVVFSSTFNKIGWIIEEGKPVLITGKKDRDSFIVRKIEHL